MTLPAGWSPRADLETDQMMTQYAEREGRMRMTDSHVELLRLLTTHLRAAGCTVDEVEPEAIFAKSGYRAIEYVIDEVNAEAVEPFPIESYRLGYGKYCKMADCTARAYADYWKDGGRISPDSNLLADVARHYAGRDA